MSTLSHAFEQHWNAQWRAAGCPARLALGYSGGLDSCVLLALLSRWAESQAEIRLFAFHIHHGLSPHADAWLAHCEQSAQALGIGFATRRVCLSAPALQAQGVEQAARQARYAALAQLCQEHEVAHLLLAHHQDDQAETFVLQALRGAGLAGLAGMAAQQRDSADGLSRLRPLLPFSRSQLQAWAKAQGLRHIEDESNQDPAYARNALRLHFLPQLAQEFPAASACFARSAANLQQSLELLQEYTARDWAQLSASAPAHTRRLALADLFAMSPARRENLLRYWLGAHGQRMPSSAQSREIWRQSASQDPDAAVCITLESAQLRRYREHLYLTARLDLRAAAPPRLDFRWQGELRLDFPAWHGSLHFAPTHEAGFAQEWLRSQTLSLQTRMAQTGYQLKLWGRPRRSLRQHWQSAAVPPWERPWLPLLQSEAGLLYVGGIGMEAAHMGQGGARWLLRWQAD
ncbi:tRNA lysidine(34) synthetase TilS [Massilia sp. W12]|uniref:tRNA lysidine(34) synthetase TilS n=1 Tax=Massilia sp. W12 TaxID=3126507 RepID=UPI0030CA7375